jgi:hypothetical protein
MTIYPKPTGVTNASDIQVTIHYDILGAADDSVKASRTVTVEPKNPTILMQAIQNDMGDWLASQYGSKLSALLQAFQNYTKADLQRWGL